MKKILIVLFALLVAGCGDAHREASHAHDDAHADEPIKGPNGGRMLIDGAFAIELAIYETGVPPEYHAWPTLDGKPISLEQVELTVELERLGGKVDRFVFTPQGDFLRGNGVVAEPHSFVVKVQAAHAGKTYSWSYDSFEGRTRISEAMAKASGIETEVVGSATLVETVTLYGRLNADPARQRDVTARFPGAITAMSKRLGDKVTAGETLAVIESNESLQKYNVAAPIGGVIVELAANPGEQSGDRVLFKIVDTSRVIAELAVFPRDRARVKVGADVIVRVTESGVQANGKIDRIDSLVGANQAVSARVSLESKDGALLAGSFVTADVSVAQRKVPLAVKASALQPFRDFTVVFEQIGEDYEVRMLESGETRGEWVEVLSGIDPGARYVTNNSYLIKADIEKSGASHDH